MPFAIFGPGIIVVTRTDIANQTPVNVGYAQELSLDLAGSTKQLYGQNQIALVAARGTVKATGKFKAAMISGLAWNSFFYGQSLVAGGVQWNVGEQHAVPAGGSVTVTNGASFDADLGPVYDATNTPAIKGSVAPGAGSYELSAGGIYVFNTADLGKTVDITYTSSTSAGESLLMKNQQIGVTPTFQLDYYTDLSGTSGGPFSARVYACVAAKHSMGFKLEDFMMPEFDFDFFALPNGNVINYVFPQIG